MPIADFEKLGTFYLGRGYDLARKKRSDDLLLYDSKDLVTHGVCVGMTGSGKTGLCITILEEAAIDSIPAIVIDPKGDLSNLLLNFPQLRPEDFAPWINEDDARRKGVEPAAFAAQQAELWRKGLAEWGEDGARVQRLRDAAEFAIYTPGSNAGLPVSVLKSFDVPPAAILEDPELLGERIATTVTSLLGLLGVSADPLQSREHILLSTILNDAWSKGRPLNLAGLIQAIQQPPVTRLGVMELESVFPSKERFGFAMSLNNLVAAPGFASWMEGEPLDIGEMLHTNGGKPRIAIFSIAHLGDAERMFFVSMLLNQILGWVRTQSGTTSLRALVYMDEIAGYFPPVANPPSKAPLLTLMKQARAFGVGVLLATQNPVDLDYKGLSNAGTWFIGRLQAERDKARVLDGLEGAAASASAGFDRQAIDGMLSQLGSRVFLMNNVHEDAPVVFETRWALSYLRGPLTRNQIKSLMDARRALPRAASEAATETTGRAERVAPTPVSNAQPVLPPAIPQFFIPIRTAPADGQLNYRPMLMGVAKVYFADPKANIDVERPTSLLVPIKPGPVPVDWEAAAEVDLTESDVEAQAAPGASFGSLPPEAGTVKSYESWKKNFGDTLFRVAKLDLFKSPSLAISSNPGESERDFRLRIAQAAREQRDAFAEKLRAKYAPKLATLQDRIRRAQQAAEVQRQQASSAKLQTAISFGAAILSAFTGRKVASSANIGKAATAARGVSRSMKESSDVGRADENIEAMQQQLADAEAEFQGELDALAGKMDPMTEALEHVCLKPKKSSINVRAVMLVWEPVAVDSSGATTPVWQ